MRFRQALIFLCCALILGSCGRSAEGTLDIALISSPEDLFTKSARLSEPAQHIRAATALGLVARDAQGEVVPGLADRWIITDDGLSFIFRLRSGDWPDGSALTAQSARTALLLAIKGTKGTALELDLAPIESVRAMAGRVIELRLSGPFPALLQLLAQPELALRPQENTGDMVLARQGAKSLLMLKAPAARGLPEEENWQERVRTVRLTALSAPAALAAFDENEAEAVLGGRIDSLPLVDIGPLSRGTIRLDPAIGLFGLLVQANTGLLADADMREALAMAIDRSALIAPFGIGGWTPTTRVVSPGLVDDPGYIAERWSDRSVDDLRAEAARRVRGWRARQQGLESGPVPLSLEIGEGPGYDRLFRGIAGQLAQIGISLQRATGEQRSDLLLIDDIARYAAPRWFLNQFNCSLHRGLCDPDVDLLVKRATASTDLTERGVLLAQAEAELTAANIYLPIGAPLRWSLIRGNVEGFAPNRWAFHPLPPMAEIAK